MEREQPRKLYLARSGFPLHGWLGLTLTLLFWSINWTWDGARTYWAFFPLWLGYCLTVDGLVFWRTRTSLLTRNWRKYIGLFLVSAPIWWAFEALNLRTQNWTYIGIDGISTLAYVFWTTLSFSTVVPAVFGSAELMASLSFLKRVPPGPPLRANRRTTMGFFVGGWIMLALLLLWPRIFFPFIWLSPYFIIEPLNVWLGNGSLADWTGSRNWRPVIALWLGVLMTAFFWEMWNYFSYPKWIYHVAWGGWLHVFEMPLLGYGGYLPFALELYAFYHLIMGVLGQHRTEYVRVYSDESIN
jgi:hypothetical protein